MSRAQSRSSGKPSSLRASGRSATPAWLLPMPRSTAASVIAIVACPRSSWARWNSLSAAGPITTIVAADPATWPAPTKTFDSSRSCSRSVTRMKSHGCQFCEDGDLRPASRIWSRSAAGIGRSEKDRTLRRDWMASQVCISVPTPARAGSFSARQRVLREERHRRRVAELEVTPRLARLEQGGRLGDVGPWRPGYQGVVVTEADPSRRQGFHLLQHEAGRGPLVGLTGHVGPAGQGQEGGVGAQAGEDAGPVAGAAAEQGGAVLRLQQVGQLAAVVHRAVLKHGL